MPQRSQQKARSRAAIVSGAARLIREEGGAGISVQAAMAGAGLTVGTFYAHFADKAELIHEAFDAAMVDSVRLLSDATNGRTGRAALQAALDAYASEWHRDHPDAGCPLPAMTGEAAAGGPSVDPSAIDGAVSTLADTVRHAAGDATDSEAIALLALMVGSQVLARALGDTPASTQVLEACRAHGTRLVAGQRDDPGPTRPPRRSR